MKEKLTNELLLYPCPVILVTSKYGNHENVFTVSWSGIACSHPEYITISVKPSRFSYHLICESKCFTANIINKNQLEIADYCGTISGRNINKFVECGIKTENGHTIDVPIITECPINIECQVESIIELGSHNLFIGKVMNKLVNKSLNNERINDMLSPVSYFRPYYYSLDTNKLGEYGKTHNSFLNV